MADSEAPSPRQLGFRMPAEWEPHAATWLAWPYSDDWPGKLSSVRWTFCEMIKNLHLGERVRLLVKDHSQERSASRQLRQLKIDLARIDFIHVETDRTWTRDNLPLFVVSGRELGAVKWRFNAWARYPEHRLDERAGRLVAKNHAKRMWLPSLEVRGKLRKLVLEGGSVDVDGEGTLMTTRRCLLGSPYARNPGITEAALEQVLLDHLGASKVIWLEDGVSGDDTSGHVDDFARFVAPGRVVLSTTTDPTHEDYAALSSARERLEQCSDAQGRRLELVELPMPAPSYYRSERLPASYANFYIGNESVLVPTFNDEADREALGLMAELFPSRRVVGIHCTDLVVGLGAIHCSTQQEPLHPRNLVVSQDFHTKS